MLSRYAYKQEIAYTQLFFLCRFHPEPAINKLLTHYIAETFLDPSNMGLEIFDSKG